MKTNNTPLLTVAFATVALLACGNARHITANDSGGGSYGKTCVGACATVTDCPLSWSAVDCVGGRCVQCKTDADCRSDKSRVRCLDSGPEAGQCGCKTDADCGGNGRVCDPPGKCFYACAKDADCPSDTPRCVNARCGFCTSDADCQKNGKLSCDKATGYCDVCKTDADCVRFTPTFPYTKCNAAGHCECPDDKACEANAGFYPGANLIWVCK